MSPCEINPPHTYLNRIFVTIKRQKPFVPLCEKSSSAISYNVVVFHVGYLGDVGLRGQAYHDVQFLQFHIDRVVVLYKEHLDLLLQDLGPAHRKTLHIRLWKRPDPKERRYGGVECDCTQEDPNISLTCKYECFFSLSILKKWDIFYLRIRHLQQQMFLLNRRRTSSFRKRHISTLGVMSVYKT